MKNIKTLIFICVLFACKASAQQFNKAVNKDSLLKRVILNIPDSKKSAFLEAYNSGNENAKEFLLITGSMPRSSKKDLIENIDSNYTKIYTLKIAFAKLVPKNHKVRIEFNPANNITSTKENIDMMIEEHKSDGEQKVTQDWNMEYNSPELKKTLELLKWDNETLKNIRKFLTDANCISIENGEAATVGFARSGLGKYSYLIFDNDLTPEQIKIHNDGCGNIFYKQNIVLLFEGGAVGSQCFPD